LLPGQPKLNNIVFVTGGKYTFGQQTKMKPCHLRQTTEHCFSNISFSL